jgi:hypothetical protein
VRSRSGARVTLLGMARIELIPSRTPDGRNVILRAVVLTPAERLRRLVRALGLPVPAR